MLKTIYNKDILDISKGDIYANMWNHSPRFLSYLFANDDYERVQVRNALIGQCCPSVVPRRSHQNYGRIELNRMDNFREDLVASPVFTHKAQMHSLLYLSIILVVLMALTMPILSYIADRPKNIFYPQTFDIMDIMQQEQEAYERKRRTPRYQSAANEQNPAALNDGAVLTELSVTGAGAGVEGTVPDYRTYTKANINLGPEYLRNMYFYRSLDDRIDNYVEQQLAALNGTTLPSRIESTAAANEKPYKPDMAKAAAHAIIVANRAAKGFGITNPSIRDIAKENNYKNHELALVDKAEVDAQNPQSHELAQVDKATAGEQNS